MRKKNKNEITEKRNDRKGKSEEIKISKHQTILADFWRSWRDLNSRAGNPTYTLSRGAPSANLGTTPCYNRIKEISNLAERIGFEPTVPFGITGFQDQLHKPLGHLSKQALPPSIFQCLLIISEKKCFVKIKLPVCRKNRCRVLRDSVKAEASANFPAFYEKTAAITGRHFEMCAYIFRQR